ncbi:MAG: hypothetical protein DRP27_03390 [Thermotogae bacterium]|nr:MAG: hypothetical protein DRP27_03390 [Thermotogota bacterium]
MYNKSRSEAICLWKRLRSGLPFHEAELVKNILKSSGIPVMLKSKSTPYTDTVYFGAGGLLDVFVPQESFEEAEALLESLSGGEKSGEESEEESSSQ